MATEKRLIDANALLETITKNVAENLTAAENVGRIIIAVTNAPTVDAVEVVRCKACKHCKKHPTSDKVKMCTNEQQWVAECYPLVHDDDFCSYGERRTEDG